MQSRTPEYKAIIIPIISHHLPNAKIILYGSRARKDEKPGSDIDIAIDAGEKLDGYLLSLIISDIEESDLPIPFDIVDIHSVPTALQDDIRKEGIVWIN